MSDQKKAPVTYSPVQIFKRGRQGVFIDPGLNGTLFTTNTGETPISLEGTTGLALDMSKDLVLGPELVVNGIFNVNLDGWTTQIGSPVWFDGSVRLSIARMGQAVTTIVGGVYIITVTIISGNNAVVRFGTDATGATGEALNTGVILGVGTYTYRVIATSTTMYISIGCASSCLLDNVSGRQILGNYALQATPSNRPTLSARRNLLIATEDFSNEVWVKSGSNISQNTITAITTPAYIYQPIPVSQNLQKKHIFTAIVKPGTSYIFWLYYTHALSYGIAFFNLNTGTTSVQTGSISYPTNLRLSVLQNGNYMISAEWIHVSDSYSYWGVGISNGTNDVAVSIGKTGYIYKADVRLASTPASCPPYQRVNAANDYDTTGFPFYLRHGPSQYLTTYLPAINVRRNLLVDKPSSKLDTWVFGNNAGTTKPYSIVKNRLFYAISFTNSGQCRILNGSNNTLTPSNTLVTFSAYFLAGTTRYVILGIVQASQNVWVCFDTTTWQMTQTGSDNGAVYIGYNIRSEGDGVYRVSLSGYLTNSPVAVSINESLVPNPGTSYNSHLGTGTTILAADAQLELGSVATPYQKITDWTSEAYASSGSVYFGTPQGMSSLHNQSIGTTYTLPAPNTDIFGWVVVPERLSPPEEEQLALYFRNRAGIIGSDNYFWQEDYGPELVTNGDFSNGTTGWVGARAIETLSVVSSRLRVTSINTSTCGASYSLIGLIVGKTYSITITGFKGNTTGQVQLLFASVSTLMGGVNCGVLSAASLTFNSTLQATATTMYIGGIMYGHAGGEYFELDNISVRELKDGMVGPLTDDYGNVLLMG